MTPEELLEEVKERFLILYHDDEAALTRMLRHALSKFQSKAGVIRRMTTNKQENEIPYDFLAVAVCHDSSKKYIPFTLCQEEKSIKLKVKTCQKTPYTIHYFLNLRKWDMEKDLPEECISLVSDYLEALIDIPNTERQRNASLSVHLDISDLNTTQNLKARLVELELAMEESKAIVPPVAVY